MIQLTSTANTQIQSSQLSSMASSSIITLLTFSLLSVLATSISDKTIKNSAEILSNLGFNSMSLTLPLISNTLISALPSSTLFTPFDTSFSLSSFTSGQPSFSLLQFHFCPRFYSFSDLQSLSYGTQIPTLNPNISLTITSFTLNDDIFINGVKIYSSPIFDDGFFVIFAIDQFFNPNFNIGTPALSPTPIGSSSECDKFTAGNGSFLEASNVLRSRGYSIMAAFLDVQLMQFGGGNDERVLTVFAPTDVAMGRYLGNFSEWGSVFLRYVVGCELNWDDLIGLNDGFVLKTLLKGFEIKVTRRSSTNNSLMLNGEVTVELPELYKNDRIVVHGLSGVMAMAVRPERPDYGGGSAYAPAHVRKGVEHVEF